MNLAEYIRRHPRGRRSELSRETKITRAYMSQLVAGIKTASPVQSARIERATNGLVSRQDLRPHDWQEIWPELAEKKPQKAKAQRTRKARPETEGR